MAKLPTVTSQVAPDLRRFIDRVREALTGSGANTLITQKDLTDGGVAVVGTGGVLASPTTITYANPHAPENVVTAAALATVIVSWNKPTYLGHAHAEIWASTTTVIGDAVMVGMASGTLFSHTIGAAGTRYYWVRFVNGLGVIGPFNATVGLSGTTGDDPEYIMEVLSESLGGTSEAPFFQIDTATTINSVSVPAGTYMKAAFIADATINRAKIQDLAVDNAKISDLNATKITAGSISADRIATGSIDADKIDSRNLSIKDANGVVVFSAGNNLAYSSVTGGPAANADQTSSNTAAAITGQGAFATLSQISTTNVGTYISNAAITNAYIGNVIQSANYSSGSAGWKIDKTGDVELNAATFRGTIDVSSAASGSRLEITSSRIRVFEGSTLRVQIGDLS